MEKNRPFSIGLTILLTMSACKPFQPRPEQFESYQKYGMDHNAVIAQMRKCGYPDGAGFVGAGGAGISLETEIRADQCMLRAGYRYRSGFGGICSVSQYKDNPACKE